MYIRPKKAIISCEQTKALTVTMADKKQKSSRKIKEERTRQVIIQDQNLTAEEPSVQQTATAEKPPVPPTATEPAGHAYTLHIEHSPGPRETPKLNENEKASPNISYSREQLDKLSSLRSKPSQTPAPVKKLSVKIWNTLEWIATSALIFMVLFFAINFQAYYEIFQMKLDKLRGVFNINPYLEKILPSSEQVTQQLLPITQTSDQNKKQIPQIGLSVAPPDERVIIPRINKNVPVIEINPENLIKRDWNALEKDIQQALQNGVVHYPGTAQPGENGNVVITGHSSYFLWDPGRFKDVFALLHEVDIGDTIVVYYNQKKYLYKVYDKKVVLPEQVDVLTQGGDNRLTLITCTPVGTNLKRLIVLAKPES